MTAAIAGGIVGGILAVLLVATGVAILRKYQIKCIPKSSGNYKTSVQSLILQ